MPSLNLDLNYFDHPKTRRLIGLLGKGSDVLPIRLWAYCGRVHPETGRLPGYSAEEIESIVAWWGKPNQCVAALVKVGFLEKGEDGYSVHEWADHEGHLWAFKVRGKKAARDRWSKVAGECMTHASSMPEACNKQCPNDTNDPNQPTTGAGDDGGDGSNPSDPANILAEQVGIASNIGPIQREKVKALIAIDGFEAAKAALLDAIAKGIGPPACINYANKVLSGEKAKRQLARKPEGNKPLTGTKVYSI